MYSKFFANCFPAGLELIKIQLFRVIRSVWGQVEGKTSSPSSQTPAHAQSTLKFQDWMTGDIAISGEE